MNIILKIFIFHMLLVLSITGRSIAATEQTAEFIIHNAHAHSMFEALVHSQAQKSYSQLSILLDHDIDHPVHIYITATDDQFQNMTAGTLPDWSSAVAIGDNRIVLSPLEGHKHDLAHLLTHEIVHILINAAAPDQNIPRWFHEGVAELASGSMGVRGRLYLTWKASRRELLSFNDIQSIFSSGRTDATLAYDQSMLAVKYLIAQHGRNVVPSIIDCLQVGDTFAQALMTETGGNEDAFERAFILHLQDTYKIRSIIGFIPNIWTVILLIALLAYIATKLRTRRIMRKWDDEDSNTAHNDFHDENGPFY